jgi:serine protease Do
MAAFLHSNRGGANVAYPWAMNTRVIDVTASAIRTVVVAVSLASVPVVAICQEPAHHTSSSRPTANPLAQLNQALEQLASKVAPSVVQIESTGFGAAEDDTRATGAIIVRQHAIGAGVIVDADGFIMTNAHVIDGAHRIRVTLSIAGKFQRRDATVIGVERQADLALLKVDAHDLEALRFNRNQPRSGELVVAIGSPNGLQNSVTMGVISSAWRQPDPDNPMVYLQTDAPINRGNSGGPLVDVTGQIVGLNTFIITSSGGSEGLGFAIPAPVVEFVYHSLREYGRVDHVDIGIVAQTVTPAIAEGLGLAQDSGVVIADLAAHGPAEAAGIKVGDIVVKVDGYTMQGLPEFTAILYQHPAKRPLQVDVLRGVEKLSFEVGAFFVRDALAGQLAAVDPDDSHIDRLDVLGMDLDDTVRAVMPGVRSPAGVVVIGRARTFNSVDTGLQPGDVISSLNRTSIASVADLRAAVAQLKRGEPVVVRVERLRGFKFVTFEME